MKLKVFLFSVVMLFSINLNASSQKQTCSEALKLAIEDAKDVTLRAPLLAVLTFKGDTGKIDALLEKYSCEKADLKRKTDSDLREYVVFCIATNLENLIHKERSLHFADTPNGIKPYLLSDIAELSSDDPLVQVLTEVKEKWKRDTKKNSKKLIGVLAGALPLREDENYQYDFMILGQKLLFLNFYRTVDPGILLPNTEHKDGLETSQAVNELALATKAQYKKDILKMLKTLGPSNHLNILKTTGSYVLSFPPTDPHPMALYLFHHLKTGKVLSVFVRE